MINGSLHRSSDKNSSRLTFVVTEVQRPLTYSKITHSSLNCRLVFDQLLIIHLVTYHDEEGNT